MPDEDVSLTEIQVNNNYSHSKKIKAKDKAKREKDVWDYIIIEVGIACGIMLVLLAVNCMGAFDPDVSKSVAAVFLPFLKKLSL